MCTRVNGTTTKPTDMEYTLMVKVLAMKANGVMTSNMAKVWKLGQRVLVMKVNMYCQKKKVLESTNGLMDPLMKEPGWITKSMDTEPTFGLTGVNIMVSGLLMTCRVTVYIFIKMVSVMMVSMRMTKKRVMESITGLMVASMKVGGPKESNMD